MAQWLPSPACYVIVTSFRVGRPWSFPPRFLLQSGVGDTCKLSQAAPSADLRFGPQPSTQPSRSGLSFRHANDLCFTVLVSEFFFFVAVEQLDLKARNGHENLVN